MEPLITTITYCLYYSDVNGKSFLNITHTIEGSLEGAELTLLKHPLESKTVSILFIDQLVIKSEYQAFYLSIKSVCDFSVLQFGAILYTWRIVHGPAT